MTSESVAGPSRKRRIYIAGPLRGNETANVRAAIIAAETLMAKGYAVFCPHLNVLHDFLYPRPAEEWIEHDIVWLKASDAVLRLPGGSEGADIEVDAAVAGNIPVYISVRELAGALVPWVPGRPELAQHVGAAAADAADTDGMLATLARIAWEGLLYQHRCGQPPPQEDIHYVRAVQRNLKRDGEKPPATAADVVARDAQAVASDDPD